MLIELLIKEYIKLLCSVIPMQISIFFIPFKVENYTCKSCFAEVVEWRPKSLTLEFTNLSDNTIQYLVKNI